MRKTITKSITNPADSQAVTAVIDKYLVNENAIFCNLLDAEDKTIANKRVYTLENAPFDLTDNEINFLTGELPDSTWDDDLIKCFLDKHRIKYTEETTDFLSLVPEDLSIHYDPGTAPTAEQKQFALNQEKKQKLNSGFYIDDILFDSDTNARLAYAELRLKISRDPAYTVPWKASEGNWVTMNAALLDQIESAGEEHIANVFAWLQSELNKL